MIYKKNLLAGAFVAGLLAFAAPASALTLTTSAGYVTSTLGATTFYNFDGITDTSVGSFTGGAVGTVGTNPGTGGNWISVTYTNQPYDLTLVNPASYIGFYWGSPNSGNTVTVYNGASVLGSYGESDFAALTGGGPGYANLIAGLGEEITKVHFGSPCCFETDNYAYIDASAVPIGPALPLFASGLGVLGLFVRLRRHVAIAPVRSVAAR
jgi:hypothetical protein